MGETIIAWATHTVSVVHGCSKPAAVPRELLSIAEQVSGPIDAKWLKPGTSPECIRCYAETLSNKRGWTPEKWTEANEEKNVMLKPERFKEFGRVAVKPIHLPPSQRNRFFVSSMGDDFHRLVPDEFLHGLFAAANRWQHIYQFLTKRIERAAEWPGPWTKDIWLGATLGHPVTKWRLEYLRKSHALTRFVSMEPLLGDMGELDLTGIHQVIVGGESDTGFRPMDMRWARKVRDQCKEQGVAFFMKQDAAFQTERRCYLVEEDGRCFQYRQFPGELSEPIQVQPDSPVYHNKNFVGLRHPA